MVLLQPRQATGGSGGDLGRVTFEQPCRMTSEFAELQIVVGKHASGSIDDPLNGGVLNVDGQRQACDGLAITARIRRNARNVTPATPP